MQERDSLIVFCYFHATTNDYYAIDNEYSLEIFIRKEYASFLKYKEQSILKNKNTQLTFS